MLGIRICTRRSNSLSLRRLCRGFTLTELLATIMVIMIMTAAAIPLAQSTLTTFRLRAAVSGISGAIQSTRYQAISNGYQYKLVFDKASRTYQLSNDTTGSGTFTNTGVAMPYTSSKVDLGANATLQFSPSGKVSFVAGASPLVLTLSGKSGTISVSPYGNLSVVYAQ